MSMLDTNILMGQGPWTPYQMSDMGIIGSLAAILIYGGIMNPAPAEGLWWALLGFSLLSRETHPVET